MRVRGRADHGSRGAVERCLERGRDLRERELPGGRRALRRIDVIGGERLNADRVEGAEVEAPDRSRTEDGEYHDDLVSQRICDRNPVIATAPSSARPR